MIILLIYPYLLEIWVMLDLYALLIYNSHACVFCFYLIVLSYSIYDVLFTGE